MLKTEAPYGLAQEWEDFSYSRISFQMTNKASDKVLRLSAALCEGKEEEGAQKHIGKEEGL